MRRDEVHRITNVGQAHYVATGRGRPVRTTRSARRGGVSVATTLLIVFVVLKVTGNVDWPWVWVLAPLWLPWALALVILTVGAGIAVGITYGAKALDRRERRARR